PVTRASWSAGRMRRMSRRMVESGAMVRPRARNERLGPLRSAPLTPPMPSNTRSSRSKTSPSSPAVAVVVRRYNASITDRLLAGAREAYAEAGFGDGAEGGGSGAVHVIPAPGSYELPALALAAARTGRFRGVVALGCLIKGETRHDRYIAEAV